MVDDDKLAGEAGGEPEDEPKNTAPDPNDDHDLFSADQEPAEDEDSSGEEGESDPDQDEDQDLDEDDDEIYDEEDPGYEPRYQAASLIPDLPSRNEDEQGRDEDEQGRDEDEQDDAPPSFEPPLPEILRSDDPIRPVEEPGFDADQGRRRFAFSGDDYADEEPEQPHGLQPRTLVIIGGVVVSVIFIVLLGYLYFRGGQPVSDSDVILVEAPEGPTKVEPEERGGLEVPDQDKQVFDRISGEQAATPERLADGPEEPLALPDGPENGPQEEGTAAETTTEPATEVAPAAPAAPAAPVALAPAVSATPAPSAISGSFLIQLGAFGSELAAEAGWRGMEGRHSAALTGLSPDIQRADLGARGIFYRLRAGPFASRDEASGACRALKAAGQDCLVIAP